MSREQLVCVMGIACPSGTFTTSESPLQGVRELRSHTGTPREAGDRPAEEGHHLKTIISCLCMGGVL